MVEFKIRNEDLIMKHHAFPCVFKAPIEGEDGHIDMFTLGMELRDFFAAHALTSMLSQPQEITKNTPKLAATLAYEFADAMMEARAGLQGEE